MPLKYSPKR